MRKLVYRPTYQDWSAVPIQTIPGRCYSIAELLSRTVRGERLPSIGGSVFEDPRHPEKDDDETVNQACADYENSPGNDGNFDFADAWHVKDVIDEKMSQKG